VLNPAREIGARVGGRLAGMAGSFVMCARAVKSGRFISEPGPTRFLIVPPGEAPSPRHAAADAASWFRRVRTAATWGKDARRGGADRGDALIFVHGYNNSQQVVMQRHLRLAADLSEAGFLGVVVSFDWPSDDATLNYLEDRHDAKRTAMQLVDDGIRALAVRQTPDCTVNIHVMGHSTGAYVIREAFDDADDASLASSGWMVSQVVFIGADISSASLCEGRDATDSLYRHCSRLTNYSSRRDSVLKISNAKRMGVAPRVGRNGLPGSAPGKAVNVDCTEYFAHLESDAAIRQADQREEIGAFVHSWHIGNDIFTRDLFETLKGDLNHEEIATRRREADGSLVLMRGS